MIFLGMRQATVHNQREICDITWMPREMSTLMRLTWINQRRMHSESQKSAIQNDCEATF